tara:strand:- start:12880 stop:13956 length:1077 start_codon:yes stop_codon:yes gene_type:complete
MSSYWADVIEYVTKYGTPSIFSSYTIEEKEKTIGLGTFYLTFENVQIKCIKCIALDLKGPEKHTIMLSAFTNDRNLLKRFTLHAHELLTNSVKPAIRVYEFDPRLSHWMKSRSRIERNMSSVILSDTALHKFVNDIDDFNSEDTKKWYNHFCIPYKRCYLLEGPPGTGKSSLIIAIASQFKRDVCFLQIAIKGMCDQLLQSALNDIPMNAIVVIEDIDSIFDTISGKKEQVFVTFSGLLNALDGIGDANGRIVIMTSNNLKILDSSLIRPGRVDQCVHIGFANNDQIQRMLKRFFPDSTEDDQLVFVKNVRNTCKKITTAELQKFFIMHRKSSISDLIEAPDIASCAEHKEDHIHVYN